MRYAVCSMQYVVYSPPCQVTLDRESNLPALLVEASYFGLAGLEAALQVYCVLFTVYYAQF